eukprot:CAMPEP_0115552552 /NCGR_PEP_ID=MMETSP0271-20121206/96298_1 /TAXON_ID=71861 /ORGANISM="Scrippsiella trochoidea, Strain CCMP3099" /LENGTH=78 /DNA_ID=CAMNT_0002986173 /DNA_START=34 /DNA_END=266 /DNA_ORIENTATION=-
MSLSFSLVGFLMNVLSGAIVGGDMVLNRIMRQQDWPYWFTMALGVLLASGLVSAGMYRSGTALPARRRRHARSPGASS